MNSRKATEANAAMIATTKKCFPIYAPFTFGTGIGLPAAMGTPTLAKPCEIFFPATKPTRMAAMVIKISVQFNFTNAPLFPLSV